MTSIAFPYADIGSVCELAIALTEDAGLDDILSTDQGSVSIIGRFDH